MKKIIMLFACLSFITACSQKEQNAFAKDFELENQIIEDINLHNLKTVSNDTGILFIGNKEDINAAQLFIESLEKKSINKAYYLKIDDRNKEEILKKFEVTNPPVIIAYQNGKKIATLTEITKDNLNTLIDEIYPQTCTDRC